MKLRSVVGHFKEHVLTLQTVGDFCALCASACADPALSCDVAYHLVAEWLLFPVASTLL
ncbi:unnamed protein product [Staurois parvus]|uniref:Uncharacterized protein n=1 Tax=Staurois parvus TaxID=386267 RepID=A0ABN9EKR5_9NEOB|nr:unnamed protein product [Staurois parvus]